MKAAYGWGPLDVNPLKQLRRLSAHSAVSHMRGITNTILLWGLQDVPELRAAAAYGPSGEHAYLPAPFPLNEFWSEFKVRCVHATVLLCECGWVPQSDLDSMEAYLFIGLPAFAVLELLVAANNAGTLSDVLPSAGHVHAAVACEPAVQAEPAVQDERAVQAVQDERAASATASSSPPPLPAGAAVHSTTCPAPATAASACQKTLQLLSDHVLVKDKSYSSSADPLYLLRSFLPLKVHANGVACTSVVCCSWCGVVGAGVIGVTSCWMSHGATACYW